MDNTTIDVGNYINFTVQHVTKESTGGRRYENRRYTGQIISILGVGSYNVKVRNKTEYHTVPKFKISHVWYTVQ